MQDVKDLMQCLIDAWAGVEESVIQNVIDHLLAFNTRSNSAPLYLSCLLHNYVPGRCLRSSQSNLLSVPSHKLNFGARSFRVAAPTVWNSLPADIRACTFILWIFYSSAENLLF